MDAPHDPEVQRPVPDREAVALAMTDMRDGENQIRTYIRQQWEAALGANKVALDAWRRVWPGETRFHFPVAMHDTVREIDEHLAQASFLLDSLAPELLGETLDWVLNCEYDLDDVKQALGEGVRP